MTDAYNLALDAVRNWRGDHRGYVTGHIYQLDNNQSATVILKRVGGEYADVCFACDWRQEMFPVALDRLHPFHPAGIFQ